MNLLPKLKNKHHDRIDASADEPLGIALLGDLAPLAALVQTVRARSGEHEKALDALGKARFKLRHEKDAPPPEMRLTIEREILLANGDVDGLARFERDNADALKAEAQAREQFLLDKDLLPARIAAMENMLQASAQRCAEHLPLFEIEEEAQKLFAPYAERFATVARLYAQARREAMTVAHALTRSLSIRQYDAVGEGRKLTPPDLAGALAPAAVVPSTMAGVEWESLREINQLANTLDDALTAKLAERFDASCLAGASLVTYRPKGPHDDRHLYAPEPQGPAKRPQVPPHSVGTRVVIGTV